MIRMLFTGALVVLLSSAPLARGAAAQSPGDAVVYGHDGTNVVLLAVTPSGTVTSVVRQPGSMQLAHGLMSSRDNQGLVFLRHDAVARGTHAHEFLPGGGMTTLFTVPMALGRISHITIDQGGDYLLLKADGPQRGVYRLPVGGAIQTIAVLPSPRSIGTLYAIEEDVGTGDLVVFDSDQRIYRVAPNGGVTTIAFPTSTSVLAAPGSALASDANRSMMLSFSLQVLQVDPTNGNSTRLLPIAPTLSGWGGLAPDPYQGGVLVSEFTQLPPSAVVHRFDPSTNLATTIASLPPLLYGETVVLGGRNLAPQSRPISGGPYDVLLSIPPEAGRPYVAAAAFGTYRGITLPGGRRIPLDADGLFIASQNLPTLFQGFSGVLDAQGTARLRVAIPGRLTGLRFHIAAITLDPNGVRIITRPLGITIE